MVLDALAYHPSLTQYLRFVATTLGRDKLLRAVQYFARFYAWYLLRTDALPASIAPWDALKRQLGLARKLLRVGKPVEHLRAAAVAADDRGSHGKGKEVAGGGNDGKTGNGGCFLRYATVARQLAYAVYLTLDTCVLPEALGMRKSPRAPLIQRAAFRAWAAGILFSLAAQLYTLRSLDRRQAAISRKDGEGVVETKRIANERSASRTQILCDLCDLTIPASALGWAPLDDGFVGLAGTLSSLIGIQAQWKKSA